MAVRVLPYRAPLKGLPPLEDWKEDASCNDLPSELFELGDFDMDADQQHLLIARGLQECTACPVRQACLNNSSELDRHWTTRGGQPPEGLFEEAEMPAFRSTVQGGPPPANKGDRLPPEGTCVNGHTDRWRVRVDGGRECLSCKSDQAKARRAQKRARKLERELTATIT